jgi:16S rRNA (guanine966-N2)-methyltransferase
VRIIAGTMKGRRLAAPPVGDLAIRPTSDRAREALFSILEAWPKGSFVDLFGGTGAVALEAASRGFGPVACVEKAPAACLLKNLEGSGVRLLRRPVGRLAAGDFEGAAVVFADPPYGQFLEAWAQVAALAAAWLAPDGVLVFETSSREELPASPAWKLHDRRDYGEARFHFFTPA